MRVPGSSFARLRPFATISERPGQSVTPTLTPHATTGMVRPFATMLYRVGSSLVAAVAAPGPFTATITDQGRGCQTTSNPGPLDAHSLILLQSVRAMRLDPARLYGVTTSSRGAQADTVRQHAFAALKSAPTRAGGSWT